MPLNPLGRERNGRQRILNLVSYTARDLAPGGLLLRLEKVREIFENNDVAGSLSLVTERSDRNRDIQRSVRQRHLHLAGGETHTIRASEQRFEILEHLGREHVAERCATRKRVCFVMRSLGMEHAQQSLIGMGHTPVGIE